MTRRRVTLTRLASGLLPPTPTPPEPGADEEPPPPPPPAPESHRPRRPADVRDAAAARRVGQDGGTRVAVGPAVIGALVVSVAAVEPPV